jgi:predicted transcriptional regulator
VRSEGGPKTASEIANETGIEAGTVGESLSKLAKAGEVVNADRGYALPTRARTIGSEHGL